MSFEKYTVSLTQDPFIAEQCNNIYILRNQNPHFGVKYTDIFLKILRRTTHVILF